MRRRLVPLLPALAFAISCVPLKGDYSEFAGKRGRDGTVTRTESKTFAQGTYRGSLRNGFPHDEGTFTFSNGTTYEGEFRDGRFHGQGKLTFADARVVEGSFVNDREDVVTLTQPDGSVFSGPVVGGKPAGQGVLTLGDQSKVVGKFDANGVRGTGLLTDSQGVPRYAGPFRGTKPSGSGFCASGPCVMEDGRDVTLDARADAARNDAARGVDREFESLRSADVKSHSDALARIAGQRDSATARLQSHAGPGRNDECYCHIVSLCGGIVIEERVEAPANLSDAQRRAWWARHHARKKEAKRIADLRAKQKRLECRQRYAKYLGIKDDPDYRQKLARIESEVQSSLGRLQADERREAARHAEHQRALEAKRKQRLADAAEMRRRADEAAAKLEREAQRKKDEMKAKCGEEGYRRAHPCACAVSLGRPLTGTACEA